LQAGRRRDARGVDFVAAQNVEIEDAGHFVPQLLETDGGVDQASFPERRRAVTER
jgi:hypothetical protein